MYQSLEHVPNPKFVIDKAYSQLRKDGVIIIEVPNISSFDMKISRERKRLSYDLPRHLSHFSPRFLQSELAKLGFSILDVDLYNPNAVLKLTGFIGSRKKRSAATDPANGKEANLNNELDIPMQRKFKNWKTKLISSVSTVFPGWRFTIVARKIGD